MNIFYIDLNSCDKNKVNEICNLYNDGKVYAAELKKTQHCMGLYLVDFVARKYFNIEDTEIIYKEGKPCFKNSNLKFSISHSKNVVMAAFHDNEIGLDCEYNLSNRDFQKIMERYGENVADLKTASLELQRKLFYDFWTKHEAKIKLGKTFSEIYYSTNYLLEGFTISLATLNSVDIEKLIDINL